MHNDDIEDDYNLWDPEHPEWFMYDAELLNAWFWDELIKEYDEGDDSIFKNKGTGYFK